jgi:hypothetical protein
VVSAADRAEAAERDRYGHTKADHEAVGACRRPSMAARVAAYATELPMGSDAAVAFERGWDAALAEARAPYDRLTVDLRALAEEWEANGGWDLDYAARLRAVVAADSMSPPIFSEEAGG